MTGAEGRTILEVRGLTRRFGGVLALDGYRLELREGDLLGLIGPNGAGKTTAFNLLSGVLRPSAGSVRFCGREVGGWPTHRIARLGIARTFQNVRLFGDLSVLENVMAGLHARHGAGLVATALGLPSFRRRERRIAERARAALDFVGLGALAGARASDLAYGQQRLVEIARAIATEPLLLLLDEPAAGMNPSETDALAELLQRLHGELGATLLVVEHDMRLVMGVCRRVQVLEGGRLLAEGRPEEIQSNPAVIAAYLGSRRGAQHAVAG